MFKNLDYKKKRGLLLAAMVIMTFIAYQLSFKQTIQAMMVHRDLQHGMEATPVMNSTVPQIERKNAFYQQVVKGYKVKKEDTENQIWQSISGMAIAHKLLIGFSPDEPVLDTDSAVHRNLIQKDFIVKGKYFDMVRFLDTLSRSEGTGRISRLKLAVPKSTNEASSSQDLELNLTLVGKTN